MNDNKFGSNSYTYRTEIFSNIHELTNFINQQESKTNRDNLILKLENGYLKFVKRGDISFFEKIQAWFGFGSLSLANISKYITENQEKMQHDILEYGKFLSWQENYLTSSSTPSDIHSRLVADQFYEKLKKKCQKYNSTHSLNQSDISALDNISQKNHDFFTTQISQRAKKIFGENIFG